MVEVSVLQQLEAVGLGGGAADPVADLTAFLQDGYSGSYWLLGDDAGASADLTTWTDRLQLQAFTKAGGSTITSAAEATANGKIAVTFPAGTGSGYFAATLGVPSNPQTVVLVCQGAANGHAGYFAGYIVSGVGAWTVDAKSYATMPVSSDIAIHAFVRDSVTALGYRNAGGPYSPASLPAFGGSTVMHVGGSSGRSNYNAKMCSALRINGDATSDLATIFGYLNSHYALY